MSDLLNPTNAAIMQRLDEVEANIMRKLEAFFNNDEEYTNHSLSEDGLYIPKYLEDINQQVRDKNPSGYLYDDLNSPITLIRGIYWWKIFEDEKSLSESVREKFARSKNIVFPLAMQSYPYGLYVLPLPGYEIGPFSYFDAICPGSYNPREPSRISSDKELRAQIIQFYSTSKYL